MASLVNSTNIQRTNTNPQFFLENLEEEILLNSYYEVSIVQIAKSDKDMKTTDQYSL